MKWFREAGPRKILTDTPPNQSVHSRPAHSEKSISKEKQLGGAEAVSSSQVMPLADRVLLGPPTPAIPVVESSFMSYAIPALLLIVVIWFVVRKWWNSLKYNFREEKNINKEHAMRLSARPDIYYFKS